MVLQAYDFWHLFRAERCELQIGGSDQWGNITAGIELIGKRERQQAYGMVFPLITTAAGAKFGKSEAGNVWLDAAKTTPYKFYQFWINTDDRDVERYLKLFTFLPLADIAEAMKSHAADPGKRTAHRLLARDVTARVHGDSAAEEAIRTSQTIFGQGKVALHLTGEATGTVAAVPERTCSRTEFPDLAIVDLLVASGLATSKADARRGIKGKGFYLNEKPIETSDLQIREEDLQGTADNRFIMLRKGKKNYVRLVLEP
jgi:tyrosyl-tRNA synthetase